MQQRQKEEIDQFLHVIEKRFTVFEYKHKDLIWLALDVLWNIIITGWKL